jgi:geranylgeranyl diphosphate synthase, type I
VHNFSLLHDDVMDGDAMRRGRPTAWTVFGTAAAILAGDALLTVALDLVATSGHDRAGEAVATLGGAVLSLIDGQCADLAFESRVEVGLQECLTMAAAKTGALLGCACALGGLLAGAPEQQVSYLRAFGVRLGLAFQLVDDILGIWGDPAVTGKPASSDLASRKKSLPVVAAMSSGTPAGRELAPIYAGRGELSGADIVHARALVELSGGRAWSETEADLQRSRALEHLEMAGLHPRPVAEMLALADLVTSRDR